MHRIGLSPPRTACTTWRSIDAQSYAGSSGSSGSAGVAVSTAFQKRGTRVRVAPAFRARTTDTSAFGPANAPGSRKPVLNGPAAPAFETTARARAKPRIATRRTAAQCTDGGGRCARSSSRQSEPDAAPRGPLAPRRPGSDARRRDRDEQEGDEQEPAGTGRRGRRGERAGRRRAGRLEDGLAWDCGSRVGALPRGRWSGVAAALGRGAEPRVLGEVEERGRVNAGSPLDLGSQGGRECRATRGRCRLAGRHKPRRGGYGLDVLGDRSIRRNRRRRSGGDRG